MRRIIMVEQVNRKMLNAQFVQTIIRTQLDVN